jgi:hypothetical protein
MLDTVSRECFYLEINGCGPCLYVDSLECCRHNIPLRCEVRHALGDFLADSDAHEFWCRSLRGGPRVAGSEAAQVPTASLRWLRHCAPWKLLEGQAVWGSGGPMVLSPRTPHFQPVARLSGSALARTARRGRRGDHRGSTFAEYRGCCGKYAWPGGIIASSDSLAPSSPRAGSARCSSTEGY